MKIIAKSGDEQAKGGQKYYQKFDFFFKRSTFRIMAEFYKEKFTNFYNEYKLVLKSTQATLFQKFAKEGWLNGTNKLEI